MKIVADQRIILGAPGCGKTTRLLSILEKELADGVPPNRIAYVSFTKKAVEEAVSRAAERFNYTAKELPYFRTLHSLCFQLLALRRTDVMSRAAYQELGDELGYRFGAYELSPEDGFPVSGNEGDRLLFITQLARNRLVTLEEQWHTVNDPGIDLFALKRVFHAVQTYKTERGLLDFTDMLEQLVVEQRTLDVDVVVIDEAQDLSNLQWEVCKKLFGGAKRLYIAGDDDQAIYRWSGADVEQFLSLEGEREVLGVSYRLPKAVHAVASRVIERVQHRFQKTWRPRDELGSVNQLPHIEMLDFSIPGSWLVLARNGYMLSETEAILRKAGLLFSTRRGTSSVEDDHYVAIRTWERLRKGSAEPGAAIRALYNQLRPGTGVARGFKGSAVFRDDEQYTMQELRDKHGLLTQGIWHDALEGIALNTREYYLTVLRAGRKLSDAPRVKIGTIHSVKGGEADNVALMLDMSRKTFQGYQQFPDDEQRVFYVGMTRARHNLFLLDAKSPQSFAA